MESSKINNSVYETYGDRWYTAYDDPIALLRAENRVKHPWIIEQIQKYKMGPALRVLDIGCGAGFLTNELAQIGFNVTGVDVSGSSLDVARKHDLTHSVSYLKADAFHLPFEDGAFDIVTALDFLEHIERPQDIIKEVSRVLGPQGLFFYHTFNRNFLSWLIVIKFVEWFVKNTPKNMHVINLFIRPRELEEFCVNAGLKIEEQTGLRICLSSISLKSFVSGVVPKNLKFKLTSSTLLSYMGMAIKN